MANLPKINYLKNGDRGQLVLQADSSTVMEFRLHPQAPAPLNSWLFKQLERQWLHYYLSVATGIKHNIYKRESNFWPVGWNGKYYLVAEFLSPNAYVENTDFSYSCRRLYDLYVKNLGKNRIDTTGF